MPCKFLPRSIRNEDAEETDIRQALAEIKQKPIYRRSDWRNTDCDSRKFMQYELQNLLQIVAKIFVTHF